VKYRRSERALFSAVGDDILALHVERGLCFGMKEVSARVWDLLAEPHSAEQLCDSLLDEYSVDAETCRSDITQLLAEMEAEGLVERVG